MYKNQNNLIGKIVRDSEIKPPLPNIKRITEFFVECSAMGDTKKMKIYGKHDTIISGKRIEIFYRINPDGNWVDEYSILDNE